MTGTYTEITGIRPTTISRDGAQVRLILRTVGADLHLQFSREHLEALIDQLIAISEASELNASLGSERQPDLPEHINVPASLRIDEAVIAVRDNSLLIRWGLIAQSGQINIYGNAFEALRFAFAPSVGTPQ